MQIEIVFALADRQELIGLDIAEGATVADLIARSNLARHFPDVDFAKLQAGIWGNPVERSHTLRDGDRVELYRPLEIDPKEARRLKVRG